MWVTTPLQAVEELNNLGRLVQLNACELKQPQLSRMLMCLMADECLWTMEVQRAFQALQQQCLGLAARSVASANPLDDAFISDELRTRPAKRKRDEIWRKCLKRAGQNPVVPHDDESPQSATNCSESWLPAPTYISGSSGGEVMVNAAENPAPLTHRIADPHVPFVWNTGATSGSAGEDDSAESFLSLSPNGGELLDSAKHRAPHTSPLSLFNQSPVPFTFETGVNKIGVVPQPTFVSPQKRKAPCDSQGAHASPLDSLQTTIRTLCENLDFQDIELETGTSESNIWDPEPIIASFAADAFKDLRPDAERTKGR